MALLGEFQRNYVFINLANDLRLKDVLAAQQVIKDEIKDRTALIKFNIFRCSQTMGVAKGGQVVQNPL